jgi:hypothetical protein
MHIIGKILGIMNKILTKFFIKLILNKYYNRRQPHKFNYEPTPCTNWKSTNFIVNYEDGCT